MRTPQDLFAEITAVQVLVKLHHWAISKTKDAYATHIALGDYYDSIDGLLDDLVETYQGKYGIVSIKIPSMFITMDITDKLKAFAAMLESCTAFGERDTNTYLYNQLDELTSITYKTIYKLVNLKDA